MEPELNQVQLAVVATYFDDWPQGQADGQFRLDRGVPGRKKYENWVGVLSFHVCDIV